MSDEEMKFGLNWSSNPKALKKCRWRRSIRTPSPDMDRHMLNHFQRSEPPEPVTREYAYKAASLGRPRKLFRLTA